MKGPKGNQGLKGEPGNPGVTISVVKGAKGEPGLPGPPTLSGNICQNANYTNHQTVKGDKVCQFSILLLITKKLFNLRVLKVNEESMENLVHQELQ